MGKSLTPVLFGGLATFLTAGLLGFIGAAGGSDPGFTPVLVGMIVGAFTWYILANLAGNRRNTAASDADKAAAVAFRTQPGKAMLIVFREGFVGKAVGLNIIVDGRPRAQIKSPRFTAIPLEPGSHAIEMAFGALAAKQNRASQESVVVAAGEVIIYAARVSLGALKNTIAVERITVNSVIADRLDDMVMTAPIDPA